MTAPADGEEIREMSAGEAFAVLANETRIAILRELWESGEPMSFTVLQKTVAPDDTGNFNYHLGKLDGQFVRKTEDGYVLRFAGEQVVRAVLSGTITSDPSIPPVETDKRCPYCNASMEMAYREETISVRCTDCDGVVGGEFPDGTTVHFEFPPAGLTGRDHEGVVDAAHVLYDSKIAPMMKGVCPECAGSISISHELCTDHEPDDAGLCPRCDTRFEVWSTFTCENCRYSRQSAPWFAALNHPAVVAFYHDHGLTEKLPFRKLTADNSQFVRGVTTTVTTTDPYRFRTTIPVEDEILVVAMNEGLDVLSVERTSQDGPPE
jgi:hypothetical protein